MPDSKLRIAIYDPSGQGGICHYTYELAQQLALLGNDVTLLTSENYELKHLPRNFKRVCLFKASRAKRIAVAMIAAYGGKARAFEDPGTRRAARPSEKSAVRSYIKQLRLTLTWLKAAGFFLWQRPHVIHLQWFVDRTLEPRFISLLKWLGFKLVYTVHDLLPQEVDANVVEGVLRRTYNKVDALIVHAERTKKELVSVFNVDPDRVYVIPHGSSQLSRLANPEISKEDAKAGLGISSQQKVILFFGIIKRYKGLEYLIEAFRDVKRQVDNTTLVIVGDIYQGHFEDFKYYSGLLEELKACKDVLCIANYVPIEDVHRYLSAADLVVLPYTRTYSSGVLLTAYAAGRPVIVTDTGALSEVVESGKSGVVVPPADAQALAQAIIDLVTGKKMDEMGRYAKHLAEEKYSWKKVAARTTELYQSLGGL